MENDFHPAIHTVFDVWATYDSNSRKPHYPSYDVTTRKIGSALDLDGAERILREAIQQECEARFREKIHSFRIKEMALGIYSPDWHSLSEYIYDHTGERLDCRPFSYQDGVFRGRGPDQVRFKDGDLCEVLLCDRAFLGHVVAVPPSIERAKKINGGPFKMGALDDSYTILVPSLWADTEHVEPMESIFVFPPRFKVSPRTEGSLRKAYNDYKTFPMRMSICDTAAEARLREAVSAMGWEGTIEKPRWKDDTFKLMLDGVPGFPEGLDLQILQKKAWNHMDRILISFRRLAGLPAEGRGYRLKRIDPPQMLIKGATIPEVSLYRL